MGLAIKRGFATRRQGQGTLTPAGRPWQGAQPVHGSADTSYRRIGEWMSGLETEGVLPHEFGVFVRSEAELDRARSAVEAAGLAYKTLEGTVEAISGQSISTMHLAKGLEFRAVV